MVEQNARRCLQICDRGYVLDQGRNAYTGTGSDLTNDPKVIELYLGTLAKALTADRPAARRRSSLTAQGPADQRWSGPSRVRCRCGDSMTPVT